jgi:hypothetical protein
MTLVGLTDVYDLCKDGDSSCRSHRHLTLRPTIPNERYGLFTEAEGFWQ